jgi:hypothetical protein
MRDNSYNNEVLHVVDYFNNSLIAKNDKIVNDVFNQKIAAQSKIDIGANRVTADKIYDLDKNILRENKEVNRSRIGINLLRIFGVCLAVAGAILILLAVLGPIPSLNTI